jgi:hypothetical protein
MVAESYLVAGSMTYNEETSSGELLKLLVNGFFISVSDAEVFFCVYFPETCFVYKLPALGSRNKRY